MQWDHKSCDLFRPITAVVCKHKWRAMHSYTDIIVMRYKDVGNSSDQFLTKPLKTEPRNQLGNQSIISTKSFILPSFIFIILWSHDDEFIFEGSASYRLEWVNQEPSSSRHYGEPIRRLRNQSKITTIWYREVQGGPVIGPPLWRKARDSSVNGLPF